MDYPLVRHENAAPKHKVRDPEQRESLDEKERKFLLGF